MPAFVPKKIKEDKWKPLASNKPYAVRSKPDDVIYIRLGLNPSFYMKLTSTSTKGRVIKSVDYDSGEETILSQLNENASTSVGRSSQSEIRVQMGVISRKHVEMTLDQILIVVKDLTSTNGTFLYTDSPHFDIDNYLESHDPSKQAESTTDLVQQEFGPEVNDFLKRYQENKGKTS